PFEYYKMLVTDLRSMNLIPIVLIFHDDYDIMLDRYNKIENEFLADYIIRNEGRCIKVDDLLKYENDNIIQFCIMDEFPTLQQAEEKIKSTYGSSINIHVVRNVQYLGCALEILSPIASKYSAAKFVMELHNIKSSEMIAFGDDINDLELLKNAGLSFAMGNALEEVKEIANKVTASNDEDGIAIELEKLLLE
ncbi:HAD hydrolase family protein, partial [bacterium]|nr:HAD hydrolase family protein [bacterium]